MNFIRLALLTLLIITGLDCSALSRRDFSGHPESKRTLYIQNFTNNTFQPDINIKITDRLRDEIQRRKNFILVEKPEEAALRLSGEVILYHREGKLYDNYRKATYYEISAYCRIRISQTLRGKNYELTSAELGGRVNFSAREETIDPEYQSLERLLRKVAFEINETLEQTFLSTLTTNQ